MMEAITPARRLVCWAMWLGYGAVWIGLAIEPVSREDWLLENLLVAALFGVMAAYRKRLRFRMTDCAAMVMFLLLHAYGANRSYGATPMDFWLEVWFGAGRHAFDRLVHLAYGMLLVIPLRQLLKRWTGLRAGSAGALALAVLLAAGACYELIEMWVALIAAPELGTLFIGTQGDPWDTQRDMALELYGALTALTLDAARRLIPRRIKPASA